MSAHAKFDFYEKVRCVSGDPANAQIAGKLAAILGRAQSDDGIWSYAVHVYGESVCYNCLEVELESTGEFAKREDFYSGESVRVSTDGRVLHKAPEETGRERQ